MITAVHTLIYSDDPDATRRFLTDVLQWPSVDAGDGWLIYRTGPSELGVHPTGGPVETRTDGAPRHEISLVCDDVEATVAELTAHGATFAGGVEDRGFGLVATMNVPGADPILLYEPRHPMAAL